MHDESMKKNYKISENINFFNIVLFSNNYFEIAEIM